MIAHQHAGTVEIDWSHYIRDVSPIDLNVQGARWTIEARRNRATHAGSATLRKNGSVVLVLDGDGADIAVGRCWFPAPWPVFFFARHSGAGHGQWVQYWAIHDDEPELLVSLEGENGGPIFRDFDGDGVMEWVFDDFEWYAQLDDPPMHFLVYKVRGPAGLQLCKTLPNPDRTVLPTPQFDWH
jgi:hypothetical protein